MTSQALDAAQPSPWILGRMQDLLVFIATPVMIVVAAIGLSAGIASKDVQYLVAAFGAMGHNLPGLLRAYGDRALFRRFRTRFVVAPILIGGACLAFALRDS